jgi:hypothetical protein
MVRTVKHTTSPEERRAQAEALHASIADQVEALKDTVQWARFLAFAGAFHAYSPNNVLLILAQQPTATRVAGFRKWQELGRQVRRGEKAIRIFGFRTKKIEDEPADGTGEAGEGRTLTYYPMLSVFDIGQTDPIDPEAADLEPLARHLAGTDEAGILDAVADYLTGAGWSVERIPLPRAANGYTTTDGSRRVVIDADLPPAQAAKTALHEAAHVLLHADDEPGEYAAHRGIKETEAESVAYVTAGLLGLDTAAYSIGYVAGWADGDPAIIRAAAAAVLRTVHTLADALTGQPVTV